ncbi:MAG TPA: CHAD domain-containing protein [Solirubrobacteraceae bacterium]|nr:CHAD domain-containing protein [Solirubrobacteraceae bacterium]
MARARAIPGIDAEAAFAEAAARTVEVRAAELREHLGGVLDTSDIERVHDARVATRRLRAVLEIFAACFEREEHRAVLREVKRLADALGERRDPDVQIEFLEAFAAAVRRSDRAGVRLLGRRFAAEQERANRDLAAALDRTAEQDLLARLGRLVAAARASLEPQAPEAPEAPEAADGPETEAPGGGPEADGEPASAPGDEPVQA